MIPLVAHRNELREQERVVRRVAAEVFKRRKMQIPFLVGTMIELPRAALTADQIAEYAEFFSFGTNDLTQTTFGISRDDSGKFLPKYIDAQILGTEPFSSIDRAGVGELMRIGVEKGRKARKGIKIGICGEHGGDPATVHFCHQLGMDYVSCSPFRVPIARFAAAQAALGDPRPPATTGPRGNSKPKSPAPKPPAKKPVRKKAPKATPKKPRAKKGPAREKVPA
jgi:pyruvate,orthophosphate dikinase